MAYEISCAILIVIVHHKSTILALHLSFSIGVFWSKH
ncbi:hypothetical protein CCACVL1_14748 [Corchorus capsularis]|uniref:Uncharacterized protein n=1 Tax=Corchorus capsularis TaxID=210143 RepID=A0A1R3I5P5_COCAP|nr:hypothetical protein CCACVL1_14748 [Corchorus capsularis]